MMKIKIFKIRLSNLFIEGDQKILDGFLRQNNILKFETAFINEEESYWSVILYYDELKLQHVNESTPEKYSATQGELTDNEIKILESL